MKTKGETFANSSRDALLRLYRVAHAARGTTIRPGGVTKKGTGRAQRLANRISLRTGKLAPRARMGAALERIGEEFGAHHLRPHYRGARETLANSLRSLRRKRGGGPRLLTRTNRRKALASILKKQRAGGAGPLPKHLRARMDAALGRLAGEFAQDLKSRVGRIRKAAENIRKRADGTPNRWGRYMTINTREKASIKKLHPYTGRRGDNPGGGKKWHKHDAGSPSVRLSSALERIGEAFGKDERRARVVKRIRSATISRDTRLPWLNGRRLVAIKARRIVDRIGPSGRLNARKARMEAALERLEGVFARGAGERVLRVVAARNRAYRRVVGTGPVHKKASKIMDRIRWGKGGRLGPRAKMSAALSRIGEAFASNVTREGRIKRIAVALRNAGRSGSAAAGAPLRKDHRRHLRNIARALKGKLMRGGAVRYGPLRRSGIRHEPGRRRGYDW